MMVEILCGILGGANFGPCIPDKAFEDKPMNLGQCYIAINPRCFAPDFQFRLNQYLKMIRKTTPVDPERPVLVPGDLEKQAKEKVEKVGGLRYDAVQIEKLAKITSKYGIHPLKDIHGHIVGMGGAGGYVCKANCATK